MAEQISVEGNSSAMPSELSRNGFDLRNVRTGEERDYSPMSEEGRAKSETELNERMSETPSSLDEQNPDAGENVLNELQSFDEKKISDSQDIDRKHKEPQSLPASALNSMAAAANPKTLKTYQSHVRVFKDWLKSEGLPVEFEYCSAEELSSWLMKFYRDGRRKDGVEWKPSSLKIIRFAINLHLKSEPYKRSISITRDEQFREANSIISDRQKELQQLGLDATGTRESKESANPLTSDDIRQLWSRGIIGISSPKALHRFAFMIVAVNFGITTRIGLHLLKPSMFRFGVDEGSCLPYAQYNPKGDVTNQLNKKATKANRKMLGIPGSPQCPVTALKLYIQKRNAEGTEAFFHTPNRHYKETGVWFTPQPTGKNTLGRLMKDIATEGKLAHPYTNHSLRYTSQFVFFQAVQGTCSLPEPPAYRISDGKMRLLQLSEMSARTFCQVSTGPPALKKIETSGHGATNEKTAIQLSTHTLNGPSVLLHPSAVIALPMPGNMSSSVTAPPTKRRRLLSPTEDLPNVVSIRNGAGPVNSGSTISLSSRSDSLVQERLSTTSNTSAIKAHHVLCVPQQWEMGEIIKAINSGEAIILSKHNLRENKQKDGDRQQCPRNTHHTDTKQGINQEDTHKYATDTHHIGNQTRDSQKYSRDTSQRASHRSSPPPAVSHVASPKLSRTSRKQLEPKKLRPESEFEMENEDEEESAIAYHEAVAMIESKLTVIERLHKIHPTKDNTTRLRKISKRLDTMLEHVTRMSAEEDSA